MKNGPRTQQEKHIPRNTDEAIENLMGMEGLKKRPKVENYRTRCRVFGKFVGNSAKTAKDIFSTIKTLTTICKTEKDQVITTEDIIGKFSPKKVKGKTGLNPLRKFLWSNSKAISGVFQFVTIGNKVYARGGRSFQNHKDQDARAAGYAEAMTKCEQATFDPITKDWLRAINFESPTLIKMIPSKIIEKVDPGFFKWQETAKAPIPHDEDEAIDEEQELEEFLEEHED